QPIELIASRKQMTPVYLRVIGTFQGDALWPMVKAFLDEQPVAAPAAAPVVQEQETQSFDEPSLPADTQAIREEAALASRRPAMPSVAEPMTEMTEMTQMTDELDEIETPSRVPDMMPVVKAGAMPRGMPRSGSAPKAATSSPEAAITGEPDLAGMIVSSMGGGLALDARYPKEPQTQLLLDQDGRVHLLRRQTAGELRAAIVDLIEVRDWVREHLELLALTQRQCKFDAKAEPVLHLFTGEAKAAAALVSKLGPFVKLHLLQEVRIGTQGTWVCTDLN
ncbi:MAG: hypothetical protein WD768_07150, partial [Phycisphaeraceae bacterium]